MPIDDQETGVRHKEKVAAQCTWHGVAEEEEYIRCRSISCICSRVLSGESASDHVVGAESVPGRHVNEEGATTSSTRLPPSQFHSNVVR